MASPGVQLDDIHHLQESPSDAAFGEAQKWIEQVTGRSFGYKDFRTGLENGVLLCELLNAIKPGVVKKINRLPTPIAGLDNIILFLRGCKELGLKDSQLFDPGDLQDTSNRVTVKSTDYNRKLKNVLVTIYWLGKAANNCISFNGATLNLKEFEGLLTQMRKETEDIESPKRSIRDSGYIDCWDSERSDSLSPPRHGRDDSFDSLDSFGSRSQQTPSPDVVLRGSSDGRGSDSESDFPHRRIPDMKKDDMLARRTSYGEIKTLVPFNQYLPNKNNQTTYIPAPLRKKKAEREEYRKSWSTATSPMGGERPFRSMSMFDMRDEEEAVIQPHSRAYQEQLQNVNSLLKEEDDKWQDDLARWKTRRRSASQDLIKKEEERRKMERMLSGDYDLSERRKSIKTYKEIVEEKERREKELHEAYMKATSREEAEMVLQKYIEKFTISEAILERLQMPKILERRHSVESNSLSLTKETSPMKYLRQQSLPVPKFTATFEAAIVPPSGSEAAVSRDLVSPNKTTVTKALPVLTPKPYSQPKNKQVLKTFKVGGKETMNGELCNGTEEKERECEPFAPSPGGSLVFQGVAKVDESPVEVKQETTHIELSLRRPKSNSASRELTDIIQEETDGANQREAPDSVTSAERPNLGHASQEGFKKSEKSFGNFSTTVSSLEFTPSFHPKQPVAKEEEESGREEETNVPATEEVVTSKACDQEDVRAFQYFKPGAETCQVTCHTADHQVDSNSNESLSSLIPPENASKRFNLWSWDPEEERKRQERWQKEQERLLQERYQKEQEKLKEEWEKAQKEVEEEERKYYEEERKIIEDTVVPFTTSVSSASLPASSSSSLAAEMDRSSQPLERPLPEQGHGQELKESQMQVADSSSGAGQAKEKASEVVREQKDLMWDLDGGSFHKSQEGEMQKEKRSVNKMTTGHPEPQLQRVSEQGQQRLMASQDLPAKMHLNLLPDTSWDHQLLTKESCVSKDVSLNTPPLDYSPGNQAYSLGGMKRMASPVNIRAGQVSPSSPSQQCPSPNRSVSGKKLCSSCELPLGKGAAMIIDTLNLYFHIQCFKCGICKGELGDVTTGTDVRIRNGLLNCNDCYLRSRTAGQPTPL